MCEIYNIRDYQSLKDQERIAKLAREIMSQIDTSPCEIPFGGVIYESPLGFIAPEKDPA